jgi:hypothetical protein
MNRVVEEQLVLLKVLAGPGDTRREPAER